MKKIVFIFTLLLTFISCVSAQDNKFYLGEKIPGIYIITDTNGKKVFAQIKKIQRTDTNELVYCTQPGTVLSSEEYQKYDSEGYSFRLNSETSRRIKLISYYGYMYQDHTDIRWYAVTQFLIWREVLPENWDLYFTNSNKVRNDNLFIDEINEINNLINNHKDKPSIFGNYSYNYKSDIKIFDDNNLLNNYYVSLGKVNNNSYSISDLSPGIYNIVGNIKEYTTPFFYHHETGQDVFDKGDVIDTSFSFNLRIMGGKLKINECDKETFNNLFIGGTYEILDQDDNVIETITCHEGKECLSSYLPVGKYKVRVLNINDEYEENNNVFNININDENITEENICYLKKTKELIKEEIKEEVVEFENETEEVLDNEYVEVYIPSTYKTSAFIFVIILATISSIGIYLFFYENNL